MRRGFNGLTPRFEPCNYKEVGISTHTLLDLRLILFTVVLMTPVYLLLSAVLGLKHFHGLPFCGLWVETWKTVSY